ncbi:hypothetical protein ABVK25_005371 [Lepraria finkii]|uniref:DUF6594 domain-containing protein n=1 Tax=Lepraria finkii TaxID=1340010 RepID=A0ABR4B8S2_9LECA
MNLCNIMSTTPLIEDYRPGYPQFSALIGADPAFHICRRFSRARMRLLVYAQDRITRLEEELDRIDQEESNPLFLGANRIDSNPNRLQALKNLEQALEVYDGLLDRNSKALSFHKATARDVESLRRWVDGTGCLARNETTFLQHEKDLMKLVAPFDTATAKVEPLIEDALIFLAGKLHLSLPRAVSSDDNVFFLSPKYLRILTQLIICVVTVTVLWVPTMILDSIQSRVGLLFGMFCAAGLFTLVMSLFSQARTVEVFVAGAGYAAVLVVFISGNSIHAAAS